MKYILIAIFAMALNSAKGQITIGPGYVEVNPALEALFKKSEIKTDTVKVVLLVSDTAHVINQYMQLITHKDAGCNDSSKHHNMLTEHYKDVYEDLGYRKNSASFIMFGYSVREKHNQNERSNGNSYCWNCEDYWMHVKYLDDKKQPLKQTIIVWQSIEAKP